MSRDTVRGLRQALHLSQTDLARLLEVQDRTVRRWESGESPVNAFVYERLNELIDVVDRRSRLGLAAINPDSATTVLLRYEKAQWESRDITDPLGLTGVPHGVHEAIISTIAIAAPAGRPVQFVTFDPDSYGHWLDARSDTAVARDLWADIASHPR